MVQAAEGHVSFQGRNMTSVQERTFVLAACWRNSWSFEATNFKIWTSLTSQQVWEEVARSTFWYSYAVGHECHVFFADDTKFSRNWHNPYHDATKSLGLAHFDEIAGDSRQKVRELSPSIAVSMVLCLSLFYHFARITNLGFGDPVPVFQNGKYAPQMVAGSEMRKVDFFLDDARLDFTTQMAIGRSQALRRCGNCIIENALNLSEWRLFLLVANYIPFQSWPQGICEKRQARL